MNSEFIVWFVPSGEFEEKRKQSQQLPFPVEYFENPLFAKTLPEAIALVAICEQIGAPQTDEDRKQYQDEAHKLASQYNDEPKNNVND